MVRRSGPSPLVCSSCSFILTDAEPLIYPACEKVKVKEGSTIHNSRHARKQAHSHTQTQGNEKGIDPSFEGANEVPWHGHETRSLCPSPLRG